ncbi:unnamed protein product [Polarella glacialis]|uniref:PDZ domain-containing protein n=1 Tax=Polarella glacialis TaxID=89957 RepID=A0A813GP57_POLGL|nr:unnamed protein product [Polarella glacialis]
MFMFMTPCCCVEDEHGTLVEVMPSVIDDAALGEDVKQDWDEHVFDEKLKTMAEPVDLAGAVAAEQISKEPEAEAAPESEEALSVQGSVVVEEPLLFQRTTFDVDIEKGGEKLGMYFDLLDTNICLIKGLEKGFPMDKWNQTCPEEKAVKHMDRLLSVNGKTGTLSELIKVMQDKVPLKLHLQRPTELQVSLVRTTKLGLALDFNDTSVGVSITEVNHGPFKLWCEENEVSIKAGDRILEANGDKKPHDILDHLCKTPALNMKILTWP